MVLNNICKLPSVSNSSSTIKVECCSENCWYLPPTKSYKIYKPHSSHSSVPLLWAPADGWCADGSVPRTIAWQTTDSDVLSWSSSWPAAFAIIELFCWRKLNCYQVQDEFFKRPLEPGDGCEWCWVPISISHAQKPWDSQCSSSWQSSSPGCLLHSRVLTISPGPWGCHFLSIPRILTNTVMKKSQVKGVYF